MDNLLNHPFTDDMNETLFQLMRAALTDADCAMALSGDEWKRVYRMARQQSLVGVLWTVVKDQPLPLDVAMQWASEAETIRGLNTLLNDEAARLTRRFAEAGRQTVILKGQANARLYPDPLTRQPGDIDIWVEGGRDSVLQLIDMQGASVSYHHAHLPANENGVVVEVHFRPASGNFNPFTNRRLQRWLEAAIAPHATGDFNSPSLRFALMMQLSHIQRHFMGSGVGLRQVCDYFLLLRASTPEDRREITEHLTAFGLRRTAGALMWLRGEVLHMDRALMLAEPDSYRGEWMLREVMEGGNFGHYAPKQQSGQWRRFFATRLRRLQLMRFDCREMVWCEVNYWRSIFRTLPKRIKYRTFSLRGIP